MADTAVAPLRLTAPWGSFPFDSKAERHAWFQAEGDRIAAARGAFVIALEAYAKEVMASAAHEGAFSFDNFMSETLDTADAWLAPEVRDWLGA